MRWRNGCLSFKKPVWALGRQEKDIQDYIIALGPILLGLLLVCQEVRKQTKMRKKPCHGAL